MRFDVVVIGAGLAGISAALRIQEAGKSCALVSAGQSALHFSSGSFDFLHHLPDGSPVTKPLEALPLLEDQAPEHPYALLGARRCEELALEAERLLASWSVPMRGSLRAGNHLRLTPLGKTAYAWLSSPEAMTCENIDGSQPIWPWKKAVLVNIEGFLDYYPEILVAELNARGVETECRVLSLPVLEELRINHSEFRSINIARALDSEEYFHPLTKAFDQAAGEADLLLLPACFGLNVPDLISRIATAIRKDIRVIPTLPPSLLGARISKAMIRTFLSRGGVFMPGDRAVGCEIGGSRHSRHMRKLYTANHGSVPLQAGHYLLASGSFLSRGLEADQNSVKEPVCNLDMTGVPHGRDKWTNPSFFQDQPYAGFGVRTDSSMHGYVGGVPVSNLHVAGMLLGNDHALRLGCGAGTALVTALAAACAILDSRE